MKANLLIGLTEDDMKTFNSRLVPWLGSLCLFLLILHSAGRAEAVSARLFQDQPNSAVVEIVLTRPAPATVIVEVFLPPGLAITASSPNPAKIDRQKGSVRWLLKDTQPGTLQLKLVTNQPLRLADCTALIRFRQPGSGAMVEIMAQK